MKKFLYFFGILALIAGLVSSCSKDEDEDGEDNTTVPQKRIVKVIEFPGDLDESICKYEYNDKGECVSSTFSYDGRITTYSYTHEGNTITEEITGNDEKTTRFYTLNSKGYLESRSFEYGKCALKYDNEGHLITITTTDDYGTSIESFEWKNGDVIKYKKYRKSNNHESTDSTIFKYTNKSHPTPIKNAANLSIIQITDFEIDPIISNIGVSPLHLPLHYIESIEVSTCDIETETYTYSNRIEEYDTEWILDEDGYPLKMIYKDEDTEFTYFDVTWE